ncbi:hypothetical protein HPP92_008080 [Vanilla planifolia]|uniref:Uncharacterized protein n=1 Tax=Vanilla planifolia TaxID=51239 RepID=A0A835RSG0_VANPL|nr:hypothetical protein HPP92_008248 [Vanilla planifolia]KAG0491217.1 hypothetical protein HPP92_008080 [Vanilla planifolia]
MKFHLITLVHHFPASNTPSLGAAALTLAANTPSLVAAALASAVDTPFLSSTPSASAALQLQPWERLSRHLAHRLCHCLQNYYSNLKVASSSPASPLLPQPLLLCHPFLLLTLLPPLFCLELQLLNHLASMA